MKNLESLPCTREERGGWVYCSFCGQKMRRELLFEPVDSLIGFLAIALILMLVANSLRPSSPESISPLNNSTTSLSLD